MIPENVIMELGDSDTGRTQAYAYVLELLRRADLDYNSKTLTTYEILFQRMSETELEGTIHKQSVGKNI